MPIVPRANPADITRVDSLPNARNTAKAAGSVGMGDAVAGLAQATTQAFQAHADKVDTAAYLEAQTKLSEWENGWKDPNNAKGVVAYRGENGLKLRDAMVPDHERVAGEIAQSLPSERARQKFMEFAAKDRARVHEFTNSYGLQESEKALGAKQEAFEATMSNSLTAAALAGDDKAFDEKRAQYVQGLTDYAAARGIPAEVVAQQAAVTISNARAKAVATKMGENPNVAAELLNRYGEEIEPGTRAELEARIRPVLLDTQHDDDGRSILEGVVATTTHEDGTPTVVTEPRAVRATYQQVAAANGFDISSMIRTRALSVGAGARSQHLKGTAADFSVKGKTKEQGDALIADLRSRGFEVIDERDGKTGTGPHIHAELPPSGRAAGRSVARRAPPASRGEALAAVREDPRAANPIWRKGVEQSVAKWWSIKERDEADRDSKMLESMRARVDAAPPGTPIAKVLGGDYAYATRKGWTGTLETIGNAKVTGVLVETNPVTFDRFARMAATNPGAFATPQTRKAILEASGELDTADLSRLLKSHEDMTDPAKRAKQQADWANESTRINSGLRTLGYDKLKGDVGKQRSAEFGAAYRQARRSLLETLGPGAKPTPQQEDALLSSVVKDFVVTREAPGEQSAAGRQALALESFATKLPPQTVAAARARLRAQLKREPTSNEVLQYAANAFAAKSAQ